MLFPIGLLIAWNAKTDQLRRLGSSYEYDRVAQEAALLAAQAGVIVAAAAVASTFVSIYVTMLIFYTLKETRKLADDTALIGKAQTRGYLVVRSAHLSVGRHDQVRAEIAVENIGNSYLRDICLKVSIGERYSSGDSPDLQENQTDQIQRLFLMPLERSGKAVLSLEFAASSYLSLAVQQSEPRGNMYGGFWIFLEGSISYTTQFDEPMEVEFAFASFGPFADKPLNRCDGKWPTHSDFV